MRFRVEAILPARAVIACRCIEPGDFAFPVTLDGCQVVHVEIPRALLPDGTQDPDCYAFTLASIQDAQRFAVGQEVDLKNAAYS